MSTEAIETSTQVPVSGRAAAPTPGVPTIPMAHVDKPGKFSGADFKRWQQKMMFYLTTLNLAGCLTEKLQLWLKMRRIVRSSTLRRKTGQETKGVKTSYMAKTNIMEHGQFSKTKKSKDKWSSNQKGKGVKLGPKGAIAKKPTEKFQGTCFNCNKFGHRASECRKPTQPRAHAHMTEVVTEDDVEGKLPSGYHEAGGSGMRCWPSSELSELGCFPLLELSEFDYSLSLELSEAECRLCLGGSAIFVSCKLEYNLVRIRKKDQ
ncbi:hypothetical protein Acr_17g0011240 [Actinidia rufa]|uniref:CCHC-type domain-containing protein n=1 Tax=Actinidia rufa TaxID=165716 RepID=A0A7J0G485_9ERIC|nr:hypothetical protein Acr_17g0011240 [Actinidia rufa]